MLLLWIENKFLIMDIWKMKYNSMNIVVQNLDANVVRKFTLYLMVQNCMLCTMEILILILQVLCFDQQSII